MKWLETLPFVQNVAVLRVEHDAHRRHLKLHLTLTDGSELFTNEFVSPGTRKYAFHWQAPDGTLIARWDNAPHYPELPTFPHHVHWGTTIRANKEAVLADVLAVIEQQLLPPPH